MSLSIERTTEIAAGVRDLNARFGVYCVAGVDGLWRVYGKDGATSYFIGTIAEPRNDETPAQFVEQLEVQIRAWGRVEKGY
jgi:hypothetical protein